MAASHSLSGQFRPTPTPDVYKRNMELRAKVGDLVGENRRLGHKLYPEMSGMMREWSNNRGKPGLRAQYPTFEAENDRLEEKVKSTEISNTTNRFMLRTRDRGSW